MPSIARAEENRRKVCFGSIKVEITARWLQNRRTIVGQRSAMKIVFLSARLKQGSFVVPAGIQQLINFAEDDGLLAVQRVDHKRFNFQFLRLILDVRSGCN
jgi:hypothetical protein